MVADDPPSVYAGAFWLANTLKYGSNIFWRTLTIKLLVDFKTKIYKFNPTLTKQWLYNSVYRRCVDYIQTKSGV